MDKFILFDIGGTNIKMGIIDNNNFFHKTKTFKTNISSILEDLEEIISSILEKSEFSKDIKGIAIATMGGVDVEKKKIIFVNHKTLPYFGSDFSILEKKFNLPVVVENDANAAAISEKFYHKNLKNYATVTLGTGVGIGIVKNELIRGENFLAGEFGYLIYDGQRLDDWLSFSLLDKEISKLYNIRISEYEKFDNLYKTNADFQKMIDDYFQKVVKFTYQLAIFQNLEKIFIGGGFSYINKKYFAKIQQKFLEMLEQTPYKCELLIAESKNNAGMLGAFYLLRQKFNL
ncbi:ROK family protein [Mesomycoplasma ovipneumoniae]|uniref:ROK family protein n=1 Tax=Mesomycoplasma ovipneumoniae TaxID=29562 RepID=A0AAJ2UCV8_9BACT|nr:ROK family protein [Mesomycoplasma ovipneumoniae]MDW2893134.1 ROK family protein [Mesomycoplasma ovipneumoniae]